MTASDPPPNGGSGEASSLAAEAQEIYRQRQQLEERMEALAGFLTSEGMPGLDGPLVDEEGFPRADIDVHAVRDARHQLACLKTDYRELQRRLEDILFRIHEDSARKAPDDQSNAAPTTHDETNETSETPTRQEDQPPPLLDVDQRAGRGELVMAYLPMETHKLHP
ncbi:26S Proteasome non-ATPase regulatory subunit 9, putative [Eimeria praecox]|uniref:26S Proteasome non-ATPase regulatory subunit 9, putative n=1 Tax=Eimeria praecox TaxID=51316 RepID=U6G5U6_9EIME|nr:26S Proteasome non-ATPase regulatory subunit 9, putative [Eimeria praecox]